ncbi:MAG TPA: hypothetical protein VFE11_04910, partial [Dongiaceae bacterium]|nr:hypothetical protein [Dongiaceae bacterium]
TTPKRRSNIHRPNMVINLSADLTIANPTTQKKLCVSKHSDKFRQNLGAASKDPASNRARRL